MQSSGRKITGWSLMVLMLCAGGYAVYCGLQQWVRTSPLFFVRQVEVLGNYLVPDEEILDLAQVPDSIRVFDVNRDTLVARIERHRFIDHVTVHRRLPSTLVLTVRERQPVAMLAGSHMALLDRSGEILPEAPRPAVIDLPLISGLKEKNGSFALPENAERLAWALTLLDGLEQAHIGLLHKVSELNMRDSTRVTLFLTDTAVPVYLNRSEHMLDKLYQLSQFLQYLGSSGENRRVEYINLQYDNQIIVKYERHG